MRHEPLNAGSPPKVERADAEATAAESKALEEAKLSGDRTGLHTTVHEMALRLQQLDETVCTLHYYSYHQVEYI